MTNVKVLGYIAVNFLMYKTEFSPFLNLPEAQSLIPYPTIIKSGSKLISSRLLWSKQSPPIY